MTSMPPFQSAMADLPASLDAKAVEALAANVDLEIPPACMDGVIDNLRLLARHAALLDEAMPEEKA